MKMPKTFADASVSLIPDAPTTIDSVHKLAEQLSIAMHHVRRIHAQLLEANLVEVLHRPGLSDYAKIQMIIDGNRFGEREANKLATLQDYQSRIARILT